MRSNRQYLNLPNGEMKTGIFGVDVDKVILALQWYDKEYVHTSRKVRSMFRSMTVKRSEDGEIIFKFPTYRDTPAGVLNSIAYNIKDTMYWVSKGSPIGEVHGTNYMEHLDDEISIMFGDHYLGFVDYRPDLACMKGCALKITVGYIRALYEILMKRPESGIIAKYGEDIVEQIKGARYNGFVQGAVTEMRNEIAKLTKERSAIIDQVESACNAEIRKVDDEIRKKWRAVKNEKTSQIDAQIAQLENDIKNMIEESAAGI